METKTTHDKIKRDSTHTCIFVYFTKCLFRVACNFFLKFLRLLMDCEHGRDTQLGNDIKSVILLVKYA